MSIKLNAQSGGSVALDAPTQTTSSADVTFKLPVADGTAGQVLRTDGNGNLSWVDDQGGKVLQVDALNVTARTSGTFSNGSLSSTPLTLTMTSTALNSKFLISATINGEANVEDHSVGFVLRRVIGGTGTSINIGTAAGSRSVITIMKAVGYHGNDQDSTPSTTVMSPYLDTPNQASGTAITYKLDIIGMGQGGTMYYGRTAADANGIGYERMPNNITVMEIAA